MDWTLPLDRHDFEQAQALHRQFTACCNEIAENGASVDAVAAAVASHLGATTIADLPPLARPVWIERVARALKSEPAKPLAQRSIAGIRSWPSQRVVNLHAALAEIQAIIVEALNEAHHEAIYTEISRAYS